MCDLTGNFCTSRIERLETERNHALMAGFVAVTAGALMPGVATNISKIFSNVASVMTNSASHGS